VSALEDGLKQTVGDLIGQVIDKVSWKIWATLLAVLIAGSGSIFFGSHIRVDTTAEVRNLVISGLQAASDFTTVSTESKATVTVDKKKRFLGIPLGDTHLVYEGVAKIRAGFDLSEMKIKGINQAQGSVHIILPPPHIEAIGLDIENSSILASYRRWFAPKSGTDLEDQAQHKAIATIKSHACADHILEVANKNAKQQIDKLLTQAKFQTIQIETQDPKAGSCQVA
jgi:hypothetical protein